MIGQPFTLTTDDGYELHGSTWGEAASENVVQLLHGLGEHHRRYAPLAKALADAGYFVVAHDHRGHGTHLDAADLGFLGTTDGWRHLVSDSIAIREQRIGNKSGRVFLLGHSMGSYVAQSVMLERPEIADGLILSGSTHAPRMQVIIGRWVARFERWRTSPLARSPLLAKMSFGAFNKAFEPARTEFDWLSRDPSEVDKYMADPYCGVASTNQLWIDLLGGLLSIGERRALANLPKRLPVYILSGSDDPVSAGNRIAALQQHYLDAGLTELEVHVYPEARHELFNETNAEAVRSDLLAVLHRWQRKMKGT